MGMWSYVTKSYNPAPCTHCGKLEVPGQWWVLRGYFGISGYFCPACYDLVSHDCYRKPKHPEQYKAIRVAQTIERATI
jgi:hypothetical protein